MMAKDPAILFYTSDFLSGVMDLDMEERGQYITLLCAQHQKGHLSEKTIRLLVGSVSVSVFEKFEKDDLGLFFNRRMDEEINKRLRFIDSRVNNGSLGGRPKKPKQNLMVNHMPNHMPNLSEDENENENENRDSNVIEISTDGLFNEFWTIYDKKVKRDKCLKLWSKLKPFEIESIFKTVQDYVKSQPVKQYRKDPSTYLFNKSWNDEIIDRNPETKQQNQKLFKDESELADFLNVRPDGK